MTAIGKTALAAALMALAVTAPVSAELFPTKPITIVVPFSAGGSSDTTARLVADYVSGKIGQPVVVENKTGANGQVAVNEMLSRDADGHTLLWVSHGMIATNPVLVPNLSYDPLKDLSPVTRAFTSTHILVVPNESPFQSVADIVAAARAKPGELTFASVGVGSGSHLVAEMFKAEAGIDVVHVPYKGSTDALPDVISGRHAFFFDGPANSVPMIKEGKLRALAVTDTERAVFLPDVQTTAEIGYPGTQLNSWFGFVVKAGTSEEIITKLHAELSAALKDPEIVSRLNAIGSAARPSGSPGEFAEFFLSETGRLAPIAKLAQAGQ